MSKRGIKLSAGTKKGIKIKVPKGIRPTTGLTKRSLFDRLGKWVEGKKVLELYAGSGAVGFEALSRGAQSVIFIDKSRKSALAIKENAKILGFQDRVKVINKDVLKAMRELVEMGEKFDFIFADPPYSQEGIERLFELIPELLHEEGLFVLETHFKKEVGRASRLELIKEVRIKDATLRFYSHLSGQF